MVVLVFFFFLVFVLSKGTRLVTFVAAVLVVLVVVVVARGAEYNFIILFAYGLVFLSGSNTFKGVFRSIGPDRSTCLPYGHRVGYTSHRLIPYLTILRSRCAVVNFPDNRRRRSPRRGLCFLLPNDDDDAGRPCFLELELLTPRCLSCCRDGLFLTILLDRCWDDCDTRNDAGCFILLDDRR